MTKYTRQSKTKGVYERHNKNGMITFYIWTTIYGRHWYGGTFKTHEAAAQRLKEERLKRVINKDQWLNHQ